MNFTFFPVLSAVRRPQNLQRRFLRTACEDDSTVQIAGEKHLVRLFGYLTYSFPTLSAVRRVEDIKHFVQPAVSRGSKFNFLDADKILLFQSLKRINLSPVFSAVGRFPDVFVVVGEPADLFVKEIERFKIFGVFQLKLFPRFSRVRRRVDFAEMRDDPYFVRVYKFGTNDMRILSRLNLARLRINCRGADFNNRRSVGVLRLNSLIRRAVNLLTTRRKK